VRAFIYWFFLALLVALLAYASLFSFIPAVFLSGGIAAGFAYLGFLAWRYRRDRVWEHSRYQFRFYAALFTYVFVFWTVIGIFTNVREQRRFWARYEPYAAADGRPLGYTFYYLDHPEAWERVNSADLNRHLEQTKPERVLMIIETTKDFGRLRGYSVQAVEGFAVNAAWSAGSPPWDELRRPAKDP
jgi:hypothetical protein